MKRQSSVKISGNANLWEVIAGEAEQESALWAQALRNREEREFLPVFSPLGDERYALGLETIYEGYLLHYGRPRLFTAGDRDTTILLGDYLYAHGLVRIADHGDVGVVADLAELISLCSQLRADESPGDGPAWAATVAALGEQDGRLAIARNGLRDSGDPAALAVLAEAIVGTESLEQALALHQTRTVGEYFPER